MRSSIALVGITEVAKRALVGRKLRSDPARRDAAPEADRAAGLRQRRAVVRRLRARRDLPDAVGRRAVGVRRSPGRSASPSPSSCRRGRVLPAERACLPQRRRRLRGRDGQPRADRRPDVGSALLVDYVLTVAVSISSGVQNAASAFPWLDGHEVAVASALVVLLHGDEPARRPRSRARRSPSRRTCS